MERVNIKNLLIKITTTIANKIHIQHFQALFECSANLADSVVSLPKFFSVSSVDLDTT